MISERNRNKIENTEVFRKVQFPPFQQSLKKVGFDLLPKLKQSINQTIQNMIKINKNNDILIS